MVSFANNKFGSGCDLDFTTTNNFGDPDTSPGFANYYWSIFPFCQNVSSNVSVLPPAWTHSISSTGDKSSYTYLGWMKNTWGGNNYFTQAVSRFQQATVQGLQWPYSDGGYFLNTPAADDLWNIYVWGRNLTGNTLWAHTYRVNGK